MLQRDPATTGDVNRWGTLAALFYTGFASAGLLLFKPLVIGALIDDYGFSAKQAGLVAGVEMAGIGGAALIVVSLGAAWNRRMVVAVGAALGICGCLTPLLSHGFASVMGARLLAGLGSGLIASVVLASLGVTRSPDRNFGLYFIANYAAAAILFPAITYALAHAGADGGYLILGLLLAGVAFTVRRIPPFFAARDSPIGKLPPFPLRAAILSLSVSVVYWIGNGAVWAFIERLGLRAGASASVVGSILSVGQLASIAGALTASLLHTRFGRAAPILVTIAISVLSLALIGLAPRTAGFAAGALLFSYAWSSFLAYLGGVMSAQDVAGRVVALSVSSQTVGMAIGPALAGVLADALGYGAIVIMGIICHGLAMILLVPLVLHRRI